MPWRFWLWKKHLSKGQQWVCLAFFSWCLLIWPSMTLLKSRCLRKWSMMDTFVSATISSLHIGNGHLTTAFSGSAAISSIFNFCSFKKSILDLWMRKLEQVRISRGISSWLLTISFSWIFSPSRVLTIKPLSRFSQSAIFFSITFLMEAWFVSW